METDEQAYCVACNTPLGNAADPIPCPKCGNEDIRRVSNERAQVAEVFGLTGGELENTAWVPTYPKPGMNFMAPTVEATPFTFKYWYQGVPEYVEREFDALPLSYAPTYRTVCEQEMFGMVPNVVTDDEGTWTVVKRYRTSGETACPGKNGSIPGIADERGLNIMDTPCPLCGENPQSFHGFIYIGDGWAEIVYRLEPIERATSADAGCWVEGWWGQYGVAHLVEKAEAWGYADAEVTDLATRHLATMGPNTANNPELTDDEHDALSEASDEVERWLNDHVAPEGFYFGWNDGEFFLWSEETWGED